MTELEQYINSYFELNPEDLKKIAASFKLCTYKKGDYFLKSGHICDQLSFVQSGMLRVFVELPNKEVTQWISTKGYFISELSSFIFATPSRFNIQALLDTEIYTIYKEDYNRISEQVQAWPVLEKLFITRCFTMMEDRIFSHLSMSAEERYEKFFSQNKELFNQVPLHYLASMLGMTPETFSRIRKKALN